MIAHDPYLETLRVAREARAVLKTELATFISGCNEQAKIFAFEGSDDRRVYYHWIKMLDDNIQYEPFICKTKPRALKLLDALRDDATNLGDRVYFFLDRDFDELQGRGVTDNIYLTDRYSIENYLVCRTVVSDLLLVELQCAGDEKTRSQALELFDANYQKFLECTRDLNFRIFLARRLGIRQIGDLPSRPDNIADIKLESVAKANTPLTDLVRLEREPSEEEANALVAEFVKLIPSEQYRGKFSWLFFTKWLGLLAADRRAEEPRVFCHAKAPEGRLTNSFGLDAIAAKSRTPDSLRSFLTAIAGASAA